MDDNLPYPFKPGDWVAGIGDHRRLAKVKDVSRDEGGAVLLDLWLYRLDGTRIGRETPALGGPRTFEPCCDAAGWERIARPDFPISVKWVESETTGRVARYHAGPALPPANWTRPAPRSPHAAQPTDDALRRALEAIAAGHNDPRSLAAEALGQKT